MLRSKGSDNPLRDHSVCNLDKALDIGRRPPGCSPGHSLRLLWQTYHGCFHDDLSWRSTSSADQLYRREFWHISRPDVATPPAFTALLGATIMPFAPANTQAHRVCGHVGNLNNRECTPTCRNFLGLCQFHSFCVRKALPHYLGPRVFACKETHSQTCRHKSCTLSRLASRMRQHITDLFPGC